jgi:hypothetical protein
MRGLLPSMTVAMLVTGCGCGETGIQGHADASEDLHRDEVDTHETSDPDADAEPDPIDVADTAEDPDAGDPIPDPEIETSHWFLSMGDSSTEEVMGLSARGDGSIIVSGHRTAGGSDPELWFATIDGTGRVVEQRIVEGVTGAWTGSAAGLRDGGIVMGGDTHMGVATRKDVWISKTDSRGSLVWQKMIGGPHDDHSATLSATPDGGFVLSAISESFTTDPGLWLVGFAPDATVMWQIVLEPPWTRSEVTVAWTAPRPDGGLYVSASVRRTPTGTWEPWLMSLDEHQNVIWQLRVSDGPHACVDMAVDDIGVTCVGQINVSLGYAAWVARMSLDGEVLWQRSYGVGTLNRASAILPRGDGGFIIVGTAYLELSYYELWIASLDPDGAISWQKFLGERNLNDGSHASIEHLGDLVILGSQEPLSSPAPTDVLVARMGMDGSFTGSCTLLRDASVGSEAAITTLTATDVAPSIATGVVLDSAAVFRTLDMPVEILCPE